MFIPVFLQSIKFNICFKIEKQYIPFLFLNISFKGYHLYQSNLIFFQRSIKSNTFTLKILILYMFLKILIFIKFTIDINFIFKHNI